eukprot:CAMPEP_0116844732 /NCGR_PEP_ID=MMETSP0418-20121206/12863_1 /TAXON_ID=1158023 /ORGANISM="Astrosyne radiata, Strain 13vi08-1A" /LENGTH=117 /DNA_ID=CAMNT_0004475741 /DNA_START=86 /DNA_END=439 /DNA_ORIENTATION=-
MMYEKKQRDESSFTGDVSDSSLRLATISPSRQQQRPESCHDFSFSSVTGDVEVDAAEAKRFPLIKKVSKKLFCSKTGEAKDEYLVRRQYVMKHQDSFVLMKKDLDEEPGEQPLQPSA